jgi:TonB family protein
MDVIAPVPTKQVSPILPEVLRRTLAGPVDIDVTFEVDEKGSVTSASSPQSSGISEHLTRFAVGAARAWKFRPALRNGQPVRSSYTARFSFQRSR